MRVLIASIWLVCLTVSGYVGQAIAAPVKPLTFTVHEEYVSTRALGMGNAFTAVADDHSAIFYDPATLAFREDGQLRMFLRAGADTDSLKLNGQLNKVKKESSDQQIQGYSDLISSHYGDNFYFRAPTIGAMWVRPGWGIAFIPADLSLEAGVHRQLGPTLNVNSYLDSTLAFSYAHKVKWFGKFDEVSWGTTIKAVHRVYAGEAISALQLAQGSSVFSTSDADEGFTADIDLATYWKPDQQSGFFSYVRPSFAIVGRNLIDYGFKTNFHLINKKTGEPPKLGRRFDFGSKWDLPKWWVLDPHFSADIRNVGDENWTPKKGSHAGLELYWKMYNWWKGHWAVGLNEGYWTAGFGARLAWFQIDLCSFGEEMGTDSNPKEDRRYMVELALDF